MKRLPLLGHTQLDQVFAFRPNGPVSVREFLADAAALAGRFPGSGHFLNLCVDRYRFTVGLAAGLLSGQTSLQPSSQSAETLRQVRIQHPNVFCLCDGDSDSLDLPRLDFPELTERALEAVRDIPEIPEEQRAITAFTSGSTGRPVPHDKSWGSLVRNARAEASRLGLLTSTRYAVVGTVPPQHMYGFESTVLLAMHGQTPFWSGKPFYPQDIVAALQAVPRPRLLVTTPFHLSTLLSAGIDLPVVERLLSATAPLSMELAETAESRFRAPLHEIYGCTETGQLASRRLSTDPAWLPLADVCLRKEKTQVLAFGGHIEGEVPLADEVELLPDGRFLLLGRNSDLVSMAGKRSSLSFLDHQLAAIPGIVDGAFFQPDETSGETITRLCAFVVAPEFSEKQILARLRERIDAVFLPRPLLRVDSLPRNSSGKLPRAELQALYETCVQARHAAR